MAAAGLGEPGGRQLRASSGPLLIRRIVGEIDYTVMPRRMVIESPAGREAHLDVANRRLIAISAGLGHPALERLTGHCAGQGRRGSAAHLRAFFEALVDGAKSIRMRVEPLKRTSTPIAAGYRPSGFRPLSALRPRFPKTASPAIVFDSFLSKIQEDAMAWVLSIEERRRHRATPMRSTFSEAAMAGLPAPEPSATSWTLLALRPAAAGTGFAVAIDLAGARLGIAVPPDRMGHLTDAWRATLDG